METAKIASIAEAKASETAQASEASQELGAPNVDRRFTASGLGYYRGASFLGHINVHIEGATPSMLTKQWRGLTNEQSG